MIFNLRIPETELQGGRPFELCAFSSGSPFSGIRKPMSGYFAIAQPIAVWTVFRDYGEKLKLSKQIWSDNAAGSESGLWGSPARAEEDNGSLLSLPSPEVSAEETAHNSLSLVAHDRCSYHSRSGLFK